MLKRSKIRVHPPIADHNENPYIWLPQEYNMKNTDKISYELRYNKSHVHDRKRMYKLSSEIRDLGVKPDPVVNVPVVDMSNQIGTTVCVDMINSTAKRFQHKKGRPKRLFSPVSTKATIDENIGVPTNEDAKVEKIINMTEQQLAAMEFKDYFGTRIGRKGQSLQFIYNFDNWVFARVANVKVDQATGKITYYYNPSEFSALNMVPSIKNIWKQKTIYIPVRFGIDVMPIEQSEALIPANAVDPVGDMRGQENYNNVQDFYESSTNEVNGPVIELDVPYIVNLTVSAMKTFLDKYAGTTTSYKARVRKFKEICSRFNNDVDKIANFYKVKDVDDKSIIYTAINPAYSNANDFWEYVVNKSNKNTNAKTIQECVVTNVNIDEQSTTVNQPVEQAEQAESVFTETAQPAQPAQPVQPAQPAVEKVPRTGRHAPSYVQQKRVVVFDESGTRSKFDQWMVSKYPKYDFDKFFRTIQNTMIDQLRSTLSDYNMSLINDDVRSGILNALNAMNGVEIFSEFISKVKATNTISENNIKTLEWYLNCYKDFLKENNQQ